MSYHLRPIKVKGTYGKISKVYEELDEYEESLEQNNVIMALVELSDVYGALEAVVEAHGMTMKDLAEMSKATKRAFKTGTRSPKENASPGIRE